MTHPFNMHRMAAAKAEAEIERGFAAVSAAAGHPIAPFFRFPGLADSAALLDYLQQRGIAAFTVDVVTNDSYISSPARLTERTLAEIERSKGGIVLFHDIKRATAKALPGILKALNAGGYRIVHMTARTPVAPRVELLAERPDRGVEEGRGGLSDANALLRDRWPVGAYAGASSGADADRA